MRLIGQGEVVKIAVPYSQVGHNGTHVVPFACFLVGKAFPPVNRSCFIRSFSLSLNRSISTLPFQFQMYNLTSISG